MEEIDLAKLKLKDKDTFKTLVLTYQQGIFRLVLSNVKSTEEAEDLTQEVFLKVWKNLDKFNENKGSLKVWIYTVAKNTLKDKAKRKVLRFISLDKIFNLASKKESEEKNLSEQEKEVKEALKALKKDEKEIVELRYFSELSIKEIAEVLKMNENTVKTKIKRSLEKLRKVLDED